MRMCVRLAMHVYVSDSGFAHVSQGLDGGDSWGRKKVDKVGKFGGRHVTSTIRMFVDARGIDPPRLGITVCHLHHTHTHTHTHTHSLLIITYTYTHTNTNTHTHTHTHTHTQPPSYHACVCMHIFIRIHASIHPSTDTHSQEKINLTFSHTHINNHGH
jgi:hypothetical protein